MPTSANWKMIYDYARNRFAGWQGNQIVYNNISYKNNAQYPHSFLTLDSVWYGAENLTFNITAMGTDNYNLVALSNTGVYAVYNGTSWSYRGGILIGENWDELLYLNGYFVAISKSAQNIIYSGDGATNWTAVYVGANFRSITYFGGMYVAVGIDGCSYKGTTLLSFTKSTFSGLSGNCKIAAGKIGGVDGFIVLSGNSVCKSFDGLNWTQTPLSTTDSKDWVDLKYLYAAGSFYWIGVASSGANIWSTDGIIWNIYNYGEFTGSFKQLVLGVHH